MPMKTSSWSGLLPVVLAVLLVASVTAVQGVWTDRWTGRNVRAELKEAADRLEARFPNRFGRWEFVQELASDPKQLERAGAVGHISRLFSNRETGAKVSVFIVCATPHDASGHTPDRCYPGAGFEIAEAEHRQSIPLEDGRTAETFTGTFRKTGQTLRVFWTYGVDGRWIAPQIARIELAGTSAVYKLYAIIDETRLPGGEATVICGDFLSALLPEFDAAMFDRKPDAADEPAGSRPAGPAADPAGTAAVGRRTSAIGAGRDRG